VACSRGRSPRVTRSGAGGRADYPAQWQLAQEDFLQPAQLAPPPVPRWEPEMPNVDGWRSTREAPHAGQVTFVEEPNTMVSKRTWQSSQRYS